MPVPMPELERRAGELGGPQGRPLRPSAHQRAICYTTTVMPKPSPKAKAKAKIKPQPNVLFEATVRRMLATRPLPKKAVKKKAKQKLKLRKR
jgi:hypothetical protein